MADDEDLWDTLHLQPGASVEEVRVAFRDLSRLYHPDKRSASGGEGENAAFVRVHRAYRILGDEAMRSFYEKYGLPGVRLAETLDEGAVSLVDDRLQDLELRVQGLVRKHEELRAQRLLGLNGSFLLSVSTAPVASAPTFKRRFRLHYSALSHSVQIRLSERFSLTVGGASHVQSNSGAGAAKLMLAANTTVIPGTNVRASLNVTGTSPDAELSVGRSLSPHCFVQQKFGLSRDGRYLSLMFSPWLTRTLRGSLTGSFSSDPSLSFSLVKSSFGCGHRVRAFCDLQPESGEVGLMFKYKPVKGFSMKVSPSISRQGFGVQIICTKASSDALSKLHWALQVRTGGLGLRLTLYRCGLRFVIPVELWTEASGPLSATDIGLALAIWAAPPFVISLLRSGWLALSRLWATSADAAPKAAATEKLQEEAGTQRMLVADEARRRRKDEEAMNGLVILEALYGTSSPPSSEEGADNVDVTDCLMARVRQSQLQLSNAPKSTLLGFGHHQAGDSAVLTIRYRFGGLTYTRSFGEKDVVILP